MYVLAGDISLLSKNAASAIWRGRSLGPWHLVVLDPRCLLQQLERIELWGCHHVTNEALQRLRVSDWEEEARLAYVPALGKAGEDGYYRLIVGNRSSASG